MSTNARKCCVHVTSKKFFTNLLIGVSNTTNVNYADAWSCSLPASIFSNRFFDMYVLMNA